MKKKPYVQLGMRFRLGDIIHTCVKIYPDLIENRYIKVDMSAVQDTGSYTLFYFDSPFLYDIIAQEWNNLAFQPIPFKIHEEGK